MACGLLLGPVMVGLRGVVACVPPLMLLALAGCPGGAAQPSGAGAGADAGPSGTGSSWLPAYGGFYRPDRGEACFRVASSRATRIDVALFAAPLGVSEALRVALAREGSGPAWGGCVSGAQLAAVGIDIDRAALYSGYRVWGPNWTWEPTWRPGSDAGYVATVDADGDRMNPNKLLIDPYAREISHDPTSPAQHDADPYRTDGDRRDVDSGPVAPKSIVLRDHAWDVGHRPSRPLRDDLIYEVHLRGFTAGDAAATCRGTYAAAGARADYLADLGVTAVELLPVQETWNDSNDVDPGSADGDNYWGYSTLAFLAPDRRYACDKRPGGPTREFAAMVRALHQRDIKVILDVVYNHTAEGGGGSLLSLRGLDNAAYYEVDAGGAGFPDFTGTGATINAASPLVRDLVIDSLTYWSRALGVDGFRFDLAPILGNSCRRDCFRYDPSDPASALRRAADELPVRPAGGGAGVDLIAEPWGVGGGTYQIGHLPPGFSEWNDHFRDTVRQAQNQLGIAQVTPGQIAVRVSGSPDLFAHDGRRPAASIDALVNHDGLTLADLYRCNGPHNDQMWPYGPSSGGSQTNESWDQGGDPTRQRQAARTGLALVLLSAGVPMITGGDELLRSQHCNNNPYNIDSPAMWLDWSQAAAQPAFGRFARRLFAFRATHPALRPSDWQSRDRVTWRGPGGVEVGGGYMDDPGHRFLGWQLDGAAAGDPARAIYVAYNRDSAGLRLTLPPHPKATRWCRAFDTAAFLEPQGNAADPGHEQCIPGDIYDLDARAVAVFVEK